MKLPNEIIEYIYTFYNPHKDNYTKILKDLCIKFMGFKTYLEIMDTKKMIYEYELNSCFGFNIMGSDILKCIFFKRNMDKEYWINLLVCEQNEEIPYQRLREFRSQSQTQEIRDKLLLKMDLSCPLINRLEFDE